MVLEKYVEGCLDLHRTKQEDLWLAETALSEASKEKWQKVNTLDIIFLN